MRKTLFDQKTYGRKLWNVVLLLIAVMTICSCNGSTKKSAEDDRTSSGRILPSFAELKTGDTFTLGTFEQDNDTINGPEPIEWQVLAVENDKALVISKYALDAKPYNNRFIFVTWQTSSIRKWLNGDFYKNAFDASEKSMIIEVKNINPGSPVSSTRGGSATKDKIFLLSIDESDKYFADEASRQCEATAYAKKNGAYVGDNGKSWWWLRSPGSYGRAVAIVLNGGYVSYPGYEIADPFNTVRPAFWLDLK